jgi:acyl-CoA thioesterase FadM
LVEGLVQLVCVNREKQLVPLPADVIRVLERP